MIGNYLALASDWLSVAVDEPALAAGVKVRSAMRAARMTAGMGVAVLAGVVAAVGIGAGPASAHVTVNPREAMQGGHAKLAFGCRTSGTMPPP